MAINARNEAQHQRAAAEGLVEYMMTDLRSNLKGVGRLDVLNAVNDRAMRYYRDQGDLAALPADSLQTRTRVLWAMGEDYHNSGQDDLALAKFTEAHRTTAALLARAPRDADTVWAHAQSEYWLGLLPFSAGQVAAARPHFLAYRDLAHQLVAVDPDHSRAQQEVGYAEGNLCALDTQDDAARDTVEHCRAARDATRAVLALHPNDAQVLQDMASRLGWLGDAEKDAGDHAGEMASRREAVAIARRLLATDPANYDWREVLVGHLIYLARVERSQGNIARAAVVHAEALRMIGDMRQHDPSNQRWAELQNKATTP